MARLQFYDTGMYIDQLESLPQLTDRAGRVVDPETLAPVADALIVPATYLGIVQESYRAGMISMRWGLVVKSDKGVLHTTPPENGTVFATGDPRDMMYNRKNHPMRPGQPRYEWYLDPLDPGVKYGFLIDA